jgi:hypothetical protein
MKAILALATLALITLIFEEKARQVAGDAQDAYSHVAEQARNATETLTHKVERAPLISVIVAGIAGYAAAAFVPRRR